MLSAKTARSALRATYVAVVKPDTKRRRRVDDEARKLVNVVDRLALIGERACELVYEYCAGQTAPADHRALRSAHRDVLSHKEDTDIGARVGGRVLFFRETEVEDVASVLRNDHQNALVVVNQFKALLDLVGVGRWKGRG